MQVYLEEDTTGLVNYFLMRIIFMNRAAE